MLFVPVLAHTVGYQIAVRRARPMTILTIGLTLLIVVQCLGARA